MKLFSPVRVGRYALSHRVVHAPTTRLRAEEDAASSDMMIEYYGQRASNGGLIITESVHPSWDSFGYLGAPGIYTAGHVKRWKAVVDAVHAKGGVVFMQIVHDGRQSHSDLSGGKLPIAPSVVPFDGLSLTKNGWVPASPHRALDIAEMRTLVEMFQRGAELAKDAGFDGVEVHNANGYLLDTFLQDGTNKRTDDYGGSTQNRARFPLEVVDAIVSVWGPGSVGVRVSPNGTWGAISDSDPETTFGSFAQQLNDRKLAYLHVIEPRVKGVETIAEGQAPVAAASLRRSYEGTIIAAGGFNRAGAESILQTGDADLVAFGRLFTSNPDLPYRLQHDLTLTPYVRDAFWGGTERHYTDFPTFDQQQQP